MIEDSAPGWAKADHWDRRFAAGDTPWDLGFASPTLISLAKEFSLPGQSVAVPGCGSGEDALALARLGLEVVAIDWSTAAIEALKNRAAAEGLALDARKGDAYDLLAVHGPFDLIFENTFFCAQGPAAWPKYFPALRANLRPGGMILGAFFLGLQPEASPGPPFFINEKELRALVDPQLDCLRLMPSPVAPEGRESFEWAAVFRRSPSPSFAG